MELPAANIVAPGSVAPGSVAPGSVAAAVVNLSHRTTRVMVMGAKPNELRQRFGTRAFERCI